MAESFYPELDQSITLTQFIDFIENSTIIKSSQSGKYNYDDMNDVAEKLVQLADNKAIITNLLCKELSDLSKFQIDNNFKPLTIMLHEGEGYMIRALIWLPLSDMYPADVFFYYEPHDHNFDFFTTNLHGPGYRTRLYEYDYNKVEGIDGELVDFIYLDETTLPAKKVMFYYGSKDAHIQYPPDDITVSLNVVLPSDRLSSNRQYKFEIEQQKTSCQAYLRGGRIARTEQENLLFDALAAIGDDRSITLLKEIADNK